MLTRGKTEADRFVSHALRLHVVALSEDLALTAAHLSIEKKLAMADSMIYATAQVYQASLVTGDGAFRGLAGVVMPGSTRSRTTLLAISMTWFFSVLP